MVATLPNVDCWLLIPYIPAIHTRRATVRGASNKSSMEVPPDAIFKFYRRVE